MKELTEKFAKGTPKGLIDQWEKVYKSALKTYAGDQARAAATAWASVKKKYSKTDGEWIKNESLDLGTLAKQLIETASN